jgi:hypothetical protein
MQQVLGCSVSYCIAVGPQQGRKVFTLQTIPPWEDDERVAQVAKESGLFRVSCTPPFGPAEAVQNRFRRFCQPACRSRGTSLGTAETGEAMSIYFKTSGIRETALTDAFG